VKAFPSGFSPWPSPTSRQTGACLRLCAGRQQQFPPTEKQIDQRASETARDRAIFLIACFCALRPSELFGLTWDSYQGNVFVIVNTAWRGRLQRKKIKRKNRFGQTNFRLVAIPEAVGWAIEQWRADVWAPLPMH
jgi:integrase